MQKMCCICNVRVSLEDQAPVVHLPDQVQRQQQGLSLDLGRAGSWKQVVLDFPCPVHLQAVYPVASSSAQQ